MARRRFSGFGKRLFGLKHSGQWNNKQGSVLDQAMLVRRLCCEPLETRRMLSVVGFGFDIKLFEDVGGLAGNEITSGSIQAGDTFFAQITAEDLRDSPTTPGIKSLYVDVDWNPVYITEIDGSEVFNNLTTDVLVVTPNFPESRIGVLDNSYGTITGLGGEKVALSQESESAHRASSVCCILKRFPHWASTYINVSSVSLNFANDETVYDTAFYEKSFSIESGNVGRRPPATFPTRLMKTRSSMAT